MVSFILLQAEEEKQRKQERQVKDNSNNNKERGLVDGVVACFDLVVILYPCTKLGIVQHLFVYYYC